MPNTPIYLQIYAQGTKYRNYSTSGTIGRRQRPVDLFPSVCRQGEGKSYVPVHTVHYFFIILTFYLGALRISYRAASPDAILFLASR